MAQGKRGRGATAAHDTTLEIPGLTIPPEELAKLADAIALVQKYTGAVPFQAPAAPATPSPLVEDVWKDYEVIYGPQITDWGTEVGRMKHVLTWKETPESLPLGKRPVSDLNLLVIGRYVAKRRTQKTRFGTLTTKGTRNRELMRLHHMLEWAVECKLITSNPILGVSLEDESDSVRNKVMESDQFTLMLAQCRRAVVRAVLLVAYDSGMREGEVACLRREEVDMITGRVSLSAKGTKTKQARAPRLTRRAIDAIKELPVFADSPYIFTNPQSGSHYAPCTLLVWFKDACRRAGLKGFIFHDLRRSFVTLSRRVDKVEESVIMKQTGHRTASVFKRYNIVVEDDCDDALRAKEERIARERFGPKRAELTAAQLAQEELLRRRAGG